MISLLVYLTIIFYVALALFVLYCASQGLRMCFQADVEFGLIALLVCVTVIGLVPLFLLFWIKVLWKRDLADELFVYLNAPPPNKHHH